MGRQTQPPWGQASCTRETQRPPGGSGSAKHLLLVSLLSHTLLRHWRRHGRPGGSRPQETSGKARAVPLSHTQQKLRSLQGPTSAVASVPPSLVFSPLGGCIPAAPASSLFSQHVRGTWTSAPLHWGSLRCSHGSVLLLLSSFAQTSSSVGPLLASPFNITMYVSPPHRHKHIRDCPAQLHNYPVACNTF